MRGSPAKGLPSQLRKDASALNEVSYRPSRNVLPRGDVSRVALVSPPLQSSTVPTRVPGAFLSDFREAAATGRRTAFEVFFNSCCFVSVITDISISPFMLGASPAVAQHSYLKPGAIRN